VAADVGKVRVAWPSVPPLLVSFADNPPVVGWGKLLGVFPWTAHSPEARLNDTGDVLAEATPENVDSKFFTVSFVPVLFSACSGIVTVAVLIAPVRVFSEPINAAEVAGGSVLGVLPWGAKVPDARSMLTEVVAAPAAPSNMPTRELDKRHTVTIPMQLR
jgi:hypothetical protein